MTLVFVFQVAAAIAGFTLISRSRYMVSDQLDLMMRNYNYDYRLNVDWIQSKVCYNLLFPKPFAEFVTKSLNAAVTMDQPIGKGLIDFRHLIIMKQQNRITIPIMTTTTTVLIITTTKILITTIALPITTIVVLRRPQPQALRHPERISCQFHVALKIAIM